MQFESVNPHKKYCSARHREMAANDRRRKKFKQRRCECGNWFTPVHPLNIYCGPKCRAKAEKKLNRYKKHHRTHCPCGNPLPKGRTKYCSKACHAEFGKRGASKIFEALSRWVDALCPMCGRTHKVRMFWTGNGMPRIFCEGCRMTEDVATGQPEDYYQVRIW